MPIQIHTIYQPSTIREAVDLLRASRHQARFLAGGTDIALSMPKETLSLIDISKLGLGYVHHSDHWCRIGATTTVADLRRSPVLEKLAGGLLRKVAESWGSEQISNRATIGGNLAHGSPSADMGPPLLTLDARLVLVGKTRRVVPVGSFWGSTGRTVLRDELLTEIVIPLPFRKRAAWEWQKFTTVGDAVSVVTVAIGILLGPNKTCANTRLALGAVGPKPLRVKAAERLLNGRRLSEPGLVDAVATEVVSCIEPIDDLRASSEYKHAVVKILVRQQLERISSSLGGESGSAS
jgi:CO/xanthine dehydrogenase FAD-binding subunit